MSPCSEKGSSATLFARAAHCDVTPRGRPVQLAGYALRHDPATTMLDPIEISLLMLECAGERCLIFGFDLLQVGSELQAAILAKVAELGFSSRETLLLASHTHTAPATDQACCRLGAPDLKFIDDVAAAAKEMLLRILDEPPSEVSVDLFLGQLNHSINRRRHWPFPTVGRMHGFRLRSVVLSPNPSGPRNEQATAVLLRKVEDGKPLGLIWHYTCHPTAVAPYSAISSDYPGMVRSRLRERFGQIPCLFAQGFCGNIRPNIASSDRTRGLRERFRQMIRIVVFGNLFPTLAPDDWINWSKSLAAALCGIVSGRPARTLAVSTLRTGSATVALDRFFAGTTPDKRLTAQVVRIGEELELVALSAEPTVEWQRMLDEAIPPLPGQIRLYAGYLGAVFGYLPTGAQVLEGGYEVEGFQRLFGMSGHFDATRVDSAVAACVRDALKSMDGQTGRISA